MTGGAMADGRHGMHGACAGNALALHDLHATFTRTTHLPATLKAREAKLHVNQRACRIARQARGYSTAPRLRAAGARMAAKGQHRRTVN
jgi:hypothetical protein